MLELFCKRHSQARLGMLFQNIPPLGRPSETQCFHFDAEVDAGLFAEQNERWILESRASLFVEGFQNPWQLGLPKHCPATCFQLVLSVYIRAIRGSNLFSLRGCCQAA
jgi:hypothetical protein